MDGWMDWIPLDCYDYYSRAPAVLKNTVQAVRIARTYNVVNCMFETARVASVLL